MSFITPGELKAFLVRTEQNDDQLSVMDALCRASYAAMTSYTGRPTLALNPEQGSSGVGSLNTLTDTEKAWTVNAFVGQVLYDSAGTVFLISANAATTLTVSGTPASGAYYIYPLETQKYNTRSNTNTYYYSRNHYDPHYIRGNYLRLKCYPVKAIYTIYEDDDTTQALVQGTDYTLYADEGELHRYGGWIDPEYYWTYKGVGGYLPTDPEWVLLRHVQLAIGAAMWDDTGYKRFQVDQFGTAASTNVNFQVGIAQNLFEAILNQHLAKFRRIVI